MDKLEVPAGGKEKKGAPLPQLDGVLVLKKPKGPTSAKCIAQIKRHLGQKKIGHAGTLDPMAEGVLLVLLGQATKISGYLMGEAQQKIYSGVIRLGIETDTWDAEGQVVRELPAEHITQSDVDREFFPLVGEWEQEVPAYSAAKHEGKPLYALARKGLDVPVKKKIVKILSGEAELVGLTRIRFRVTCSSGTYIRSLAHSLGKRLGCGAMLEELVREYSHPFPLEQAHTLEDVLAEPESFAGKVRGIGEALPDWPKLKVSMADAAQVRNGTALVYAPELMAGLAFEPGLKALMVDAEGRILALAETALSGTVPVWKLLRGLWNPEP